MKKLYPLLREQDTVLPARVQVSVGWISVGRRESPDNYNGQAWDGALYARDRYTGTIFISPDCTKAFDVLTTLLHELVHLAAGCDCNHGAPFGWLAAAVGLVQAPENDWSSACAGPQLRGRLRQIAAALGPYPWHPITYRPRPKRS